MERLTREADFGLEDWEETLFFVSSDPNGAYNILDIAKYSDEPEFAEILKNISLRLAAYENTDLESEQVAFAKNIIEDAFSEKPEFTERMRELAQADREGRVVVLPCKVGDTVYFITGIHGRIVKPAQVEEIYIGDGSIALGVSTGFRTFTLQASEYYINREAAEEAMKAREQDD